MRILILTDRYPPFLTGGYEVACHNVAEQLRLIGHDVRVLTSHYGLDRPRIDGHVSRLLQRPQDCRSMLELGWAEARDRRQVRRAVRSAQPDVVYAWSLYQLFPSLHSVLRATRVPVVLNIQDAWLPWQLRDAQRHFDLWNAGEVPAAKRLARAGLRRALGIQRSPIAEADLVSNEVVFCSRFRHQEHVRLCLPLRRGCVIYNGVDPGRFTAGTRTTPGIHALFVGRLVSSKGAHTAVEAMQHVPAREATDVTLDVVGVPAHPYDYAEQLEHMVAASGLGARVRLLGPVSNASMPEIYREHNVLVFPSLADEGLPVTIIEAMAAGLAVVATNTGGTAEIVEDGVNGLLFPAGDSRALAQQLLRLHREPALVARLGAAGRATVERRFDVTGIAAQTAAHLERVVDEHRADVMHSAA